MIEVMRILKTLDLRMDRTVRLALWGGEEQGLLGSRAYVTTHFADPDTMELKPEHEKLRATSTRQRQRTHPRGLPVGHEAMADLEQWLAPFRDPCHDDYDSKHRY
jgi:hypothetical protein